MEHHHHHHAATSADDADMAELLDLDAEVLHGYLTDVTAWVREHVVDEPRRILDVGAGTGTGTLALAARFPDARVTAVDASAAFLHRLADKAAGLGIADRVETVAADLDAGWPAIEPVDLVWASMSLHHMADPDRVLKDVLATLRPGGLLAVAEMDVFPRFLPADVGNGLESRCHAAVDAGLAEAMPHRGADWGVPLVRAGFAIAAQRQFVVDLTPPAPAATGRYAQLTLQRLRGGLADRLGADDLATLDALLGDGPTGVRHRGDLGVHAARTVWLARRA